MSAGTAPRVNALAGGTPYDAPIGRTGFRSPNRPVTGPGASAFKYDILTALLVTASRAEPAIARLALRLSLLITARFNWQSGSFAVAQKEMARMWGVTERTAKREVAHMRGMGWISVLVPAARGRVAQYRIELDAVLAATVPHWEAVGPDFAARMSATPEPQSDPGSNVVPLHPAPDLPAEDETGWASAARRLQQEDPALYGAWVAPLIPVGVEAGVLSLAAPSGFMASYVRTHYRTRLLAAVTAENRAVRDVVIIGPDG